MTQQGPLINKTNTVSSATGIAPITVNGVSGVAETGDIDIGISGTGFVNSITATAPLTANGLSGSPQSGAITLAANNATTTTAGVASFNSTEFSVSGLGAVTSNNFTINTTSPLSGGGSLTLGGTLTLSISGSGYVASIAGTANQISASSSTGAVTLSFTDGVSIGAGFQPTAPPTHGAIIQGNLYVGASSNSFSNMQFLIQSSGTTQEGIYANATSTIARTWWLNNSRSFALGIDTTNNLTFFNNINAISTIANMGTTGGLSLGFGTTTAPSAGLAVSGQTIIGSSSVNAYDYVQIAPSMTTTNSNRGHMLAVDGGTLTYAFSSTNGRAISIANGGGLVLATGAGSLTSLDFRGIYLDMASVSKTGNGTFSNAYGIAATAFGSIATNQYSGFFIAPTGGTVNDALYADNMAIGYQTTTPPSSGLIVQGQVGIGTNATSTIMLSVIPTTSQTIGVDIEGTVNSGATITAVQLATQMAITSGSHNAYGYYVFAKPISGAGTMSTCAGVFIDTGSSNSVPANGYGLYANNPGFGGTSKCAIYGDNLSVGFTGTTPPSSGLICSGKAGFGVSSVNTNDTYQFNSTGNYNTEFSGTQTTSNSGTQLGIYITSAFNPTGGAAGVVSPLYIQPTFIAPSAQTIGTAIGCYITPLTGSNVGTITNYYGLFIEAGSGATGTISNATSLFVRTPLAATSLTANIGFIVAGTDSIGGTVGTKYMQVLNGTIIGDDGSNTISLIINNNLIPKNNNRSCYGIYSSPFIQPTSTNTITFATSGEFILTGSAASGTITTAYTVQIYSPSIGTNRVGLNLVGNDSDGSAGSKYLGYLNGTLTGDDGSNQNCLYINPSMRPLSNNIAIVGLYSVPSVTPHSTNTISSAASGVFILTGSAGSGTITSGTTVQVYTPSVGTTRVGLQVLGNDADGDSPGCRYQSLYNGTMTGDDGSIQVGIALNTSMRPTTNSRTTIGMYCIPFHQPHSTNTITIAHGGYFQSQGSVGSGAITTAYSGYFVNPSIGTNKTALYADNASIGFTAITPSTNGLFVAGQSSFGNSAISGSSASTALGMQINYQSLSSTSDFGFGSGQAGGLLNESVFTGSATGNVAAYFSYAGIYASSSNTIATATSYYGQLYQGGNAGTITTSANFTADGFNSLSSTNTNCYNFYSKGTINPASNATNVAAFFDHASYVAASSKSLTRCASFYSSPVLSSNVGSITDFYGFFFDAGSSGAGTLIGNVYGAYFSNPNFGSNRTAFYADSACIGVAPVGTTFTPTLQVGGAISTAPGVSGTATFSSGEWHNTTAQDAVVTISVLSDALASFSMGTGSATGPSTAQCTQQVLANTAQTICAYVPKNYYCKVTASGGTLQTVYAVYTPV